MGKKKLYLSLPISGRQLEEAREYASKMKEHLTYQGYEVITPFEVCPNSEEPYSRLMGHCIDVMVIATPFLAAKRADMENFKQSSVAKALGIQVDDTKLHDAEYDIEICKAIFDIVSRNKI